MKNPIHPWDTRREIAVPGDEKATLAFCVDHIMGAYKQAVSEKGYFTMALSGGSTPKAVFALLTSSPYKEQLDPKKIHLFWSDERTVPPTHPDSNYKMAMDAGFASLGIPENQIHRMHGETDIEKGVEEYEKLIRSFVKSFDYLMLGMGEDGHTASLFPGTAALKVKDKLVVANNVPQKNTVRMTLTYPCINASKHIVLYVLGEKKQEMLQEIYSHEKPCYPVEEVGTSTHKALWIADEAAAKLLHFCH